MHLQWICNVSIPLHNEIKVKSIKKNSNNNLQYRKSLCCNSLMTKNSIIFIGGYVKGYKFFIADKNLFVCILIYFNKNINFKWITKKCKNYKRIYFLLNTSFIYELENKNHIKTSMTKISHISWGVTTKAFTVLISWVLY